MGKIQQQAGKSFEEEMLACLKKSGFWAYKLPTGCGGTAFDIIASKHGRSFAFECKTVEHKEKIAYTQELQKKTPELDFYESHGGPLFLAVRFGGKAFFIPWFEAKRLFLEQGFVELIDMSGEAPAGCVGGEAPAGNVAPLNRRAACADLFDLLQNLESEVRPI